MRIYGPFFLLNENYLTYVKLNDKVKEKIFTLFDHGLSLLFSCISQEDVDKVDVMEDKRVQSFVGSGSTRKNLRLIPADKRPRLPSLTEGEREFLMNGLQEAAPQFLLDKIWEMIEKRWQYYEDFRNSK